MKPFDQAALDAASREVHMMLLREGSSWGTKACEEMGRVFMVAYHKALPSPSEADQRDAARLDWMDKNLTIIRDIGWLQGKPIRSAIDAAMSKEGK